jgi:hypothetical protein
MEQDFAQQPPQTQAETIDRVARLIQAEQRRGQAQPSALARYAERVYGIRSGRRHG